MQVIWFKYLLTSIFGTANFSKQYHHHCPKTMLQSSYWKSFNTLLFLIKFTKSLVETRKRFKRVHNSINKLFNLGEKRHHKYHNDIQVNEVMFLIMSKQITKVNKETRKRFKRVKTLTTKSFNFGGTETSLWCTNQWAPNIKS